VRSCGRAGPFVDDEISLAQDGDVRFGIEGEGTDIYDGTIHRYLLNDLVVAHFLAPKL